MGCKRQKNKFFSYNFFLKSRKAMGMEVLGWWILAIAVLIIMIIGFIVLKGKGTGAIEFLKNLFRLRR